MLASISPVGEASRRQRWPVTAAAYLVGSTVGGALLGVTAVALGTLPVLVLAPLSEVAAAVLVALATLLAVAHDRGLLPGRLPAWQRQVDETWLTSYRGWVYGAGFGLQLGAGLVTRLPTALVPATAFAAVLVATTGRPTAAVLVGATFGLVRGLPLLAAARLTDPSRLNRFHRRMEALGRPADLATSAVAAAGAATVLTLTLA